MAEFPSHKLSSLCLGTVQLGLPYGKVARTEPVPETSAMKILDDAWKNGIRCLDTARNYGIAEQRLGNWLKDRKDRPLIVSKLPSFDPSKNPNPVHFVDEHLTTSLANLRCSTLDGYLIHRPSDVHVPGLVNAVGGEITAGRISAWGVSVYTPQEFEIALGLPRLSLIQAPVSVFDTRLVTSGLLDKAAALGITVFARSVFLQGAVFLDPVNPPQALVELAPALNQLGSLAHEAGIPVGALALHSVAAMTTISTTIVGINAPNQLKEIFNWWREDIPQHLLTEALRIGEDISPELVDPRNWPQKIS